MQRRPSRNDRLQIGAVIKQTLMTTLAFAKPLSPALEAFASVAENAKPATAAPPTTPASPKALANQHLQQGIKKYEAQQYDAALEDFNRSIDLDADRPYAYFNRARVLIHQGLYDRAIADLTKAITFGGVNADQCVLHTLADANFLGYDTLMVDDCTATTSPAFCWEATLYNVKQIFGFVVNSAVIREALAKAK